jgi:hypothetical protein
MISEPVRPCQGRATITAPEFPLHQWWRIPPGEVVQTRTFELQCEDVEGHPNHHIAHLDPREYEWPTS